jgi:uncharacterized membrane protein
MPISIYTTIDDPLAASNNTGETVALGINGLGQIVGFWSYADTIGRSHSHGFLLTGGTYTSIDDPLATNTFAVGINDAGQVAGNYIDASGTSHPNNASRAAPAGIWRT